MNNRELMIQLGAEALYQNDCKEIRKSGTLLPMIPLFLVPEKHKEYCYLASLVLDAAMPDLPAMKANTP